jgi:hypothetical protein
MSNEYTMTENEKLILDKLDGDITEGFKTANEFTKPLNQMLNLISNINMRFKQEKHLKDLSTELDFLSFLQQLKIQNELLKGSYFGKLGYYKIGDQLAPLTKAVEKRIQDAKELKKGIPKLVQNGNDEYVFEILPPPKKRGRPKKSN